MYDFIITGDSELVDVILYGPYVSVREVKEGDMIRMVVRNVREFDHEDRKKVEKNYKAKKLFVRGIGPDEYNRIFAC